MRLLKYLIKKFVTFITEIAMFMIIGYIVLNIFSNNINSDYYPNTSEDINQDKTFMVDAKGVASGLKLRNSPTTSSEIITGIQTGEIVTINTSVQAQFDGKNNWVYVSYKGIQGWCCQSQKINNQTITYLSNIYHSNSNQINRNVQNPQIFIYCSHYSETYTNSSNIDITTVSKLLAEELNKVNIPTIVAEDTIYNWNYDNSYNASGLYTKEIIKKYPSLKLIIDVHRDSLSKEHSTTTINNQNYAKVSFVIGLENPNYKDNLSLANKLNDLINIYYPGLSAGVNLKEGSKVNGIYNQDLSSNSILLELGALENTKEEIDNTIKALVNILETHLTNNNSYSNYSNENINEETNNEITTPLQNRAIDPVYEIFEKIKSSIIEDYANTNTRELIAKNTNCKDYNYADKLYETLGRWVSINSENGINIYFQYENDNTLTPIICTQNGNVTQFEENIQKVKESIKDFLQKQNDTTNENQKTTPKCSYKYDENTSKPDTAGYYPHHNNKRTRQIHKI